MLWYKLVGAGLLLGSGAWAARRVNQTSMRALEELEAWQAMIRYVKAQVDCFSLPIGAILARASPALLLACGWREANAPADLRTLLARCAVRDGEGRALLFDFCEAFGKRYREEESRGCDATLALLGARIERLRTALPNQRRLCSTLWLSGSLAAVILLI